MYQNIFVCLKIYFSYFKDDGGGDRTGFMSGPIRINRIAVSYVMAVYPALSWAMNFDLAGSSKLCMTLFVMFCTRLM